MEAPNKMPPLIMCRCPKEFPLVTLLDTLKRGNKCKAQSKTKTYILASSGLGEVVLF
jgi:hypothetical protein